MGALAGSAVPVPAMTALCAADAVMGVPFYVMEAVPVATLGDPLADLASLVMFWDEPGQQFNPVTKGLTAFSGFLASGQVVDRYVTRRGLVVDDLDWYLVFARFRLAIILEQIHVRHLAGKTRGEGFDTAGDMVVLLLAQCHEAVEASPRIRTARTTPTIVSDR